MTTTTTTAFVQDYAMFPPRADAIVQTRRTPSSRDPDQSLDFCLQLDTHSRTVLIYSLHTQRVAMEVDLLGEGILDTTLLSPEAYRAYAVADRSPPNMYTSCPAWPVDDSIWDRISMSYGHYRVHAIRFIGSEVMIHVRDPMSDTNRLLVCSNSPWVFSRMLDPSAPDLSVRDLSGLTFPKLFNLYMAMAKEFQKADAERRYTGQVDFSAAAAAFLRRITRVAAAIRDAERGFLSIFNEDKTLKPFVTKGIVVAARRVAEDHKDWFLNYTGDNAHILQRITSLYVPEMNKYIAVFQEFMNKIYGRAR